jgi:hypothetical protein
MVKPLFKTLQEVSDTDLGAIPPARGGAAFKKFAQSEGASPNLQLLTGQKSNTKTKKNETSTNPMARLSLQATLALAPAATSGVTDTCGSCSTPGCRENCLSDSGHFSQDAAQRAQVIRTKFAHLHPDLFLAHLRDSQRAHAEDAWQNGLHPVFRRNTLSDIPWHKLPTAPTIIGDFEKHPSGIMIPKELKHLTGATTSEYSKETMRDAVDKEETIPYKGVHITGSVSELTTAPRIQQVLESGRNVAVPVIKTRKEEPHPFMVIEDKAGRTITAPTFNMDRDDARWADPERGHIGALTEKLQGNFGTGAYALNPHSNRFGFVREHRAGAAADVPVAIRRAHFDLGHGM